MVGAGRHGERPIELRNPYAFYVGHTPAFLDARLSPALGLAPVDAGLAAVCARGIDPDLDDPSKCGRRSRSWARLLLLLFKASGFGRRDPRGLRAGRASAAPAMAAPVMLRPSAGRPGLDSPGWRASPHHHGSSHAELPHIASPRLCPCPPRPPPGHSHSEEPEAGWPPLGRLTAYRDAVRARVEAAYAAGGGGGARGTPLAVQEALWMGYEHEAM
jgi:hypothetical protein